jgi:hypothetical protein
MMAGRPQVASTGQERLERLFVVTKCDGLEARQLTVCILSTDEFGPSLFCHFIAGTLKCVRTLAWHQ